MIKQNNLNSSRACSPKNIRLPWHMEAFREYLTYETLKVAASVFYIFEGEDFNVKNPRILEMQRLLEERTNKDAWIPNRSGSEDINWNLEGDVTRNKGRVFTSMLILYPKEWKDGKVALTDFGKSLAKGQISKSEFYKFIITHFKYPHPAWKDNWCEWNKAETELYPFIYILNALYLLYEKNEAMAYLTTEEVADYLHIYAHNSCVETGVTNILEARNQNLPAQTEREDKIHRRISDVLGFLCLTDYCYFKTNKVYLNLLDNHSKEKVSFWEKRNGQNKLDEIKKMISFPVRN